MEPWKSLQCLMWAPLDNELTQQSINCQCLPWFHGKLNGLCGGFIVGWNMSSTLNVPLLLIINFHIRAGNNIAPSGASRWRVSQCKLFCARKILVDFFSIVSCPERISLVAGIQLCWRNEAVIQHLKVCLIYALPPDIHYLSTSRVKPFVQYTTVRSTKASLFLYWSWRNYSHHWPFTASREAFVQNGY